jgi:3-oxoacyl-(acyl-carrier-protein) synthase
MQPIYLRGPSLICAHGSEMPAIIASIEQGNLPTEIRTIHTGQGTIQRGFFSIKTPEEALPDKRLASIIQGTLAQTLDQTGLSPQELQDIPILIGTVSLEIPPEEYAFNQNYLKNSSTKLQNIYPINIIEEVCHRFGLYGAVTIFNTACTSSINALNFGADLIRTARAERVLVLGFELFNDLSFWGFEGFGILSPTNCFRPFDQRRNGFILGEGSSAVLLDSHTDNADDFYFLGGASLCDTHTMAGNDPSGQVMEQVMTMALRNAGLKPKDIGVIKAHAAASDSSDLAELLAIQKVFGRTPPPFTAIKPFVGHTLGGGGLIELVIMTEALKKGFVPKTPNYELPSAEAPFGPIIANLPMRQADLLLNYFGFGGSCTSSVISNIPSPSGARTK